MEYKNYNEIAKKMAKTDQRKFKENASFFPPHDFRMLFIGCSGCGKTSALITMLIQCIDFDRLYIICPSAKDQDIYNYISELSKIGDSIHLYDKLEDFDLEVLDNDLTNVIIFDDCICEKQENIKATFCYGRHKRASIIYLSQSFFDVPKLIRTNCTHYCIFRLGQLNEIDYLHKRLGSELSISSFRKMYQHAMKIPYGFLFIDIMQEPEKKYRERFEKYLDYKSFED